MEIMKIRIGKYKRDICLIAVLLLAGVILYLGNLIFAGLGDTVLVRVNGEVYAEYSLNEDGRYEIPGYDNGINLLVIEDGSARIEEASCPDRLCVGMGRIHRGGRSIICLPNRVSVEIQGKRAGADQRPDGVTR